MFGLVHTLAARRLLRRLPRLEAVQRQPARVQTQVFQQLLEYGRATVFGHAHAFREVRSVADFQARVPARAYEELYPWLERTLKGERDILWPGRVRWFAKSSGTTNDKSKFIPITRESLRWNHQAGARDTMAMYLHLRGGDSQAFTGKGLVIGGSHEVSRFNSGARYGDLSAVLLETAPPFVNYLRAPSKRTALMAEWEAKIDRMAKETLHENITMVAGVPTWTLVLINKLFELGRIRSRNLLEVWPNLEVFFHGAVNFTPYRAQFEALLPSERMRYFELYNASEGFFAMTSDFADPAMLLDLNAGIFFEFVPVNEFGKAHPAALTVADVEEGATYALLITTPGGLWRYQIGDTVRITQKQPLKLVVSGRTKHFLNAFGEELVVENAERAVATAAEATGAHVRDFTAGPVFFAGADNGSHEWVFEFTVPPDDPARFAETLDATLQAINTDYAAKRHKSMALRFPVIHFAPEGTFDEWLRQRNRLGGQNKVPRLANNREYLDGLLALFSVRTATTTNQLTSS